MVDSVNSIFSNTGTLQSGTTLIEVPLSKYGKSVHSYQIKPVAVPSTNAESKCHFLLMRPPPGGELRSRVLSPELQALAITVKRGPNLKKPATRHTYALSSYKMLCTIAKKMK